MDEIVYTGKSLNKILSCGRYKKSAKTPKQDLDLAIKRMAEVNQDG